MAARPDHFTEAEKARVAKAAAKTVRGDNVFDHFVEDFERCLVVKREAARARNMVGYIPRLDPNLPSTPHDKGEMFDAVRKTLR